MRAGAVRLFLAGDVMTGRGVDHILPHPNEPELREPFVHDARDYVALAERHHGPIGRPVAYDYPWGKRWRSSIGQRRTYGSST